MRRIFGLCAAAGIGFTALAAGAGLVSPDPLAGFRLLPDLGPEHPTAPYPGNYTVIVGSEVPTFGDALVFKDGLLRNGTCSF
jgi:hypothetical protein